MHYATCPFRTAAAEFRHGDVRRRPLTFLLSCDATFEDLAGRLGQLAERHHGRPIAINVKLGSRR
jgi:hypothetical protein